MLSRTRNSLVVCALWICVSAVSAAEPPEMKIWPQGAPADPLKLSPERIKQLKKQKTFERIRYVDEPTIRLYQPPQGQANGCAVVVCPGGGYNLLAIDHEGYQIARWFNSFGVTAILLKYRVPRRDPDKPHEVPMQDAQRALRMTRHKAKEWNIDPNRVGMLGFSAGGNLCVMTALHSEQQTYSPVDAADKESAKPDFMIPIYAAYLGDKQDPTKLNSLVQVRAGSPPAFMAVTLDDSWRGVHAALLLVELKKAKVPAELHVYSRGGHGYGIRPSDHPVSTWHKRCEDWMRVSGWLKP
ncbi:MAG TPA: xylanase [Planctomycetaceae bacterium]|nr:xylanase [Blastopirellula sp.]HAY79092.1 xylanase [Planctomycetaceae bacterium]